MKESKVKRIDFYAVGKFDCRTCPSPITDAVPFLLFFFLKTSSQWTNMLFQPFLALSEQCSERPFRNTQQRKLASQHVWASQS